MKKYIQPKVDITELSVDDIVLTSIITGDQLDISNPNLGIDEEF